MVQKFLYTWDNVQNNRKFVIVLFFSPVQKINKFHSILTILPKTDIIQCSCITKEEEKHKTQLIQLSIHFWLQAEVKNYSPSLQSLT